MTKAEILAAAARGEGCLGRSQDDEPVFIICARDRVSSKTVHYWAIEAESIGAPPVKVERAIEDAQQMERWRETHGGGKIPD